MDVFKFINPTHPTLFDQGRIVNGLKSKMWIERYRDSSEFEFVADVETGVHLFLPIGTFVSHIETSEVMIVENHEISEEKDKVTEVKITGRGFESFLENRIVGANKDWPTYATATDDYILSADFTWNQAVQLIKDHADPDLVIDPDDALEHVAFLTDVEGDGEEVDRVISRGDLYSKLTELLAVDRLGIKTIRPGARSPFGEEDDRLVMLVHVGEDLSQKVAFSYSNGEIDTADYLWSSKRLKNAALVVSKWFESVVKDASAGINRRMMLVEAGDLDSAHSEPPGEPDRSLILLWMEIRGQMALNAQKPVELVKTESSKNSVSYKYRDHYDVGDLVTVSGQYNATSVMRISEYVEIEDESGQNGYPTFSAI